MYNCLRIDYMDPEVEPSILFSEIVLCSLAIVPTILNEYSQHIWFE